MTNEYQVSKKEQEGRDKVLSVFGNKIEFTQSPYRFDSWDMSAVTYSNVDLTNKNIFVEVKDRGVISTEYKTAFLEMSKLMKLKDLADRYDADIFYICNYTDNLMYVFNLKHISLLDIDFSERNTAKETLTDTKVSIDKLFIELPIAKGKKYKLKN